VKIDGHYDPQADIAWLRFEGYEPSTGVAEETDFGLRELAAADRQLVGLEYWRTSERLPADLPRCCQPRRSASPAEARSSRRNSAAARRLRLAHSGK
jgi:uncharacterized protein YuzE